MYFYTKINTNMQVQFIGAARTVTGSKHLITTDSGFKLLLDCGLFQGAEDADENNQNFGFEAQSIDCVILSHAHIDHSGLLPRLVAQGFKGAIYCTPATQSLCEIMLMDSAKIQQSDAAYANKKNLEAAQPPLYTLEDAEFALTLMQPVPYDTLHRINAEISFLFTDTAHILGSAAVQISLTKATNETVQLSFTGDIGRPNDHILRNPQPFAQADYIISESTYGDKIHPDATDLEQTLLKIVQDTCLERRGKIIIPAFSIDRTQELIYAIDRLKTQNFLPRGLKVFVDSPLSVKATAIINAHRECFNDEILNYAHQTDGEPFAFENLKYVSIAEESKQLNQLDEPCIIISASGMADSGRVKHHIKNNVSNAQNTILLVGYCTPSSLAGKLQMGNDFVYIFGEKHEVKAQIKTLSGYSAHADSKEIMAFLSCQNPKLVKKVFLVHGEQKPMEHLKEMLHGAGYASVEMPAKGQIFNL